MFPSECANISSTLTDFWRPAIRIAERSLFWPLERPRGALSRRTTEDAARVPSGPATNHFETGLAPAPATSTTTEAETTSNRPNQPFFFARRRTSRPRTRQTEAVESLIWTIGHVETKSGSPGADEAARRAPKRQRERLRPRFNPSRGKVDFRMTHVVFQEALRASSLPPAWCEGSRLVTAPGPSASTFSGPGGRARAGPA